MPASRRGSRRRRRASARSSDPFGREHMRLVVASCSARYSGRLNAHLPRATRLVVVKADGSVLLHSDGGSYKPLNWMSPPCTLAVSEPSAEAVAAGVTAVWT